MSEREFTEDEIARIIRRAAELETERSLSHGKSNHKGLTLSELEDVAAESGIDPELIQQAAGEFGLHQDGKTRSRTHHRTDSGKIKTRGDEIFAERWVDIVPDKEIMESLVTELNHRQGVSEDDITWWDNLWGSYDGKPRVRRTAKSTEWQFTDDTYSYVTRVLMQKRGKQFRIRVSKKQGWGTTWDQLEYMNWLFLPGCLIGGSLIGHFVFDLWWVGLASGAALYAAFYPAFKKWARSFVDKHRNEIADLADELADFALQIKREQEEHQTTTGASEADRIIEIDETDEDIEESPYPGKTGRLRNQLR